MTQPSLISRTVDTVGKSPSDKRAYRGLELTNGMRVLLISDPTGFKPERKAYGVFDLRIGGIHDPPDCPGLAELCSCLVLEAATAGTDDKFLFEWNNENRMADQTRHGFLLLSQNKLAQTLTGLSNGLCHPAFTDLDMEKTLRLRRYKRAKFGGSIFPNQGLVERRLWNRAHPCSNLFPDRPSPIHSDDAPSASELEALRQRLIEFHKAYYSANLLCLAVLSCYTLDELQNMVLAAFGNMPNKLVQPICFDAHPFDGTETAVKVYIESGMSLIGSVEIVFPLPEQCPQYRSSPDLYLAKLLEHNGPWGLLAGLKRHALGSSLKVALDVVDKISGFDTLRIKVDLAPGAPKVDLTISAVFRYLAMVRRIGPQEWFFNEVRDLLHLMLRLYPHGDVETLNTLYYLADRMQWYPLEDVVIARRQLTEYSPEAIANLLNLLTPDRCKVYILNAKSADKYNCIEERCGTRYGVEKFDSTLLASCSADWPLPASKIDAEFRMPESNRFVCSIFDLKPREPPLPRLSLQDASSPAVPRQLQLASGTLDVDTTDSRLWFLQDDVFLAPRAFISVELVAPATVASSESAILTEFYMHLLTDWLVDLGREARLAGLGLNAGRSDSGVVVVCHGFSQRLPRLLEAVLGRLTGPQFSQAMFEEVYESMDFHINKLRPDDSYSNCHFYRDLICTDVVWPTVEFQAALKAVTLDKVVQFAKLHLLNQPDRQQQQQQQQQQLFTEILVYGNVTASDAVSIGRTVASALRLKPETPDASASSSAEPAPPAQRPRERLLPSGSHHVYREFESNSDSKVSACAVYYQTVAPATEEEKLRHKVLYSLLMKVVMKTVAKVSKSWKSAEKKHKYSCVVEVEKECGSYTDGVMFFAESDQNKHPIQIEAVIDAVVKKVQTSIDNLPDKNLEKHREHLLSKLKSRARPGSMDAQNDVFWNEIIDGTYWFNRSAEMMAYLEQNSVTPKELQEFWKTWFHDKSPSVRKLSLHSISSRNFTSAASSDQYYSAYSGSLIGDPIKFRNSLDHILAPESSLVRAK